MADVLIVDDDEDVAWILEQLLLREGHAVTIATDGEAGLAALQRRMPELVILDVEMPVLDGPSMAYRLFVHNCGLENIPIVLSSGVKDLRAVATRVGTPYFMAKPFDVAGILALVRRAATERALPRPSP
jgi:DNA-binding NtrC family response regulator